MQQALLQAQEAAKLGEVPIGAVVVKDGQVLGRCHNRRELDQDPSSHAEMHAIRQACAQMGSWRLEGAELFVTMEPCLMCYGASHHTRLKRIVYGCENDKNPELLREVYQRWPKGPVLQGGVLVDECVQCLQVFFKQLR